mmetsp:Transcript_4180/g.11520  ORF Transcript_4180/g.11520 Transcript_4180/m.11520 type:complete len:317 (+) Transcript_4180:157-1107(+)
MTNGGPHSGITRLVTFVPPRRAAKQAAPTYHITRSGERPSGVAATRISVSITTGADHVRVRLIHGVVIHEPRNSVFGAILDIWHVHLQEDIGFTPTVTCLAQTCGSDCVAFTHMTPHEFLVDESWDCIVNELVNRSIHLAHHDVIRCGPTWTVVRVLFALHKVSDLVRMSQVVLARSILLRGGNGIEVGRIQIHCEVALVRVGMAVSRQDDMSPADGGAAAVPPVVNVIALLHGDAHGQEVPLGSHPVDDALLDEGAVATLERVQECSIVNDVSVVVLEHIIADGNVFIMELDPDVLEHRHPALEAVGQHQVLHII